MDNPANHAHQEALFNPKHARRVTLLGAGSVGSYVALFLVSMGVSDLEVWDDDSVESHNTPMSLYGPEDVGRYKVDALAEIVERLTGTRIKTRRKMYEGEELRNTSVVACVDKMSQRKLIWEQVKMCPTVDIFCDTRTKEWYLDVFSIVPCSPEDIERYEAAYYSDHEAGRQMCGRHGIVQVSCRAAQVVASNLATYWQKGKKKWRYAEQCDMLESVFDSHQ